MAFDKLDITISGESADAVSAIQSVKSSLSGLDRSASSAEDSVEEVGDSATDASVSMSALAASATASALSVVGLSSVSTGASGSMTALAASVGGVVVALGALAAVLTPLIIALGGLATAGAAVAGVFGLLGGAAVATQFEKIRAAAGNAKDGILAAVEPLGRALLPVITELLDRLPRVAQEIVRALGPLDPLVEAFEDFGNAILDALPAIAEFAANLTRDVLPGLREFASVMSDLLPGAVRGMVAAGRALGAAITDFLQFIRGLRQSRSAARVFTAIEESILPLIPLLGRLKRQFDPVIRQLVREAPAAIRAIGSIAQDLIELATAVSSVLAPVFATLVSVLGDIVSLFNSLPGSIQKLLVAAVVLGPAISALAATLSAAGTAAVAIGSALGGIATVASGLVTVISGLVAILGGPLTAALAVGAGLIAAYTTNFLGFRDAVNGAIEAVSEFLSLLAQIPGDLLNVSVGGDAGAQLDERPGRGPVDDPGPSLATGGRIIEGGLARLHSGEQVVPAAEVDRRDSSANSQPMRVEVVVEEDTEVVNTRVREAGRSAAEDVIVRQGDRVQQQTGTRTRPR